MNVNKKERSKSQAEALSHQERAIFTEIEIAMRKKKMYRNRTLSLEGLAKELGVLRNTLSRVVNKCSGKNFCQYVNSYRIAEAVKLIVNRSKTGAKLQSIWRQVGFASRTPFYAAMKRNCNLSVAEISSDKRPKIKKKLHHTA